LRQERTSPSEKTLHEQTITGTSSSELLRKPLFPATWTDAALPDDSGIYRSLKGWSDLKPAMRIGPRLTWCSGAPGVTHTGEAWDAAECLAPLALATGQRRSRLALGQIQASATVLQEGRTASLEA
jgi:hypothetical protein